MIAPVPASTTVHPAPGVRHPRRQLPPPSRQRPPLSAVTDDVLPPTVRRLYGVALMAGFGGLFFLFVGDLWMTGASLALSVGGALLAWGTERRAELARSVGYACVGTALALLLIDTLQTYVL